MPEQFSLARGIPSVDLLPASELGVAAGEALAGLDDLLLYGDAAGLQELRAWFAARLGADPAHVLLTNGSLHGLDLVANALHPEREWIAVEAPTYDFALTTLERTGCRIVAIDRGVDDLDLDALGDEIVRAGPPRLAYVIPTFQNPSGGTLAAAARTRLVALAREYDFPIVEDDPYREIAFCGAPPAPMRDVAPDHVILATSLSKTVAPGMRVGALVIPPAHFAAVRLLASHTYVAPARFAHGVAWAFCSSERYDRHLAATVASLAARAGALTDALNAELGTSYTMPTGGYFLWIAAPQGDADSAVAEAAAHGVHIQPGTPFFADDRGTGFLRLSFAGTPADAMPVVASRLRAAWGQTDLRALAS